MEIPSGSWKLHYGLLSTGNDEERSERVEIKPGTYPAIDVPDKYAKDGKTENPPVEIVLGGRLTPVMDAHYNEGSNKLIVKGETFRAYGERGEIYHSLWPKVFEYSYKIMDDRGALAGGSARMYTEKEAKPTHAAMAFAKNPEKKAKRQPQGDLWVWFTGSNKILGKLSCTRRPVIPGAKKDNEDEGAEGKDAGSNGGEKKGH
jgi:hypothetical protein